MSQPITLLVGTMTGNGELVAQELVTPLREAGYAPSIMMMDAADAGDLVGGGLYLIVSSTYGNGDVPDNAQSFFASLQASRPRLSDVVYGLIALGDTTYKATFCEGGMKFDRLLTELGARRAGAPLLHDANSGSLPEDDALDWIADWIEQGLAPAIAA